MRQVIGRFLKHLEAEKNASLYTIESYQYDLHKFDAYLINGREKRDILNFSFLSRSSSRSQACAQAKLICRKRNGTGACGDAGVQSRNISEPLAIPQ